MLWFDMVVEFWCKSPSCKSGICSALLRLRTDFAETTSDNDVSLPEMFNSAVSYFFQPHTTEHVHFPNAQSCTKSHFRPSHHLMTEFSGPSALGEQRYATERVPSIRSDWLKRPWSLGRDRKMVLKRLHEISRNRGRFTTLQKFWQSEDVSTPRNSSRKLTLVTFLACGVLHQERFLGVRLPWSLSRGHTRVIWKIEAGWAQLPELWI